MQSRPRCLKSRAAGNPQLVGNILQRADDTGKNLTVAMVHRYEIWLVVWLPFFIFPYIGNNHPNWLIFFRGVAQPPTRDALINHYWSSTCFSMKSENDNHFWWIGLREHLEENPIYFMGKFTGKSWWFPVKISWEKTHPLTFGDSESPSGKLWHSYWTWPQKYSWCTY